MALGNESVIIVNVTTVDDKNNNFLNLMFTTEITITYIAKER